MTDPDSDKKAKYQDLVAQAKEAAKRAYAPYSQFYVGAALLFEDGSVITAGNVENASYGLTICAERSAIVRAIAEGKTKKDFKAIAIWAETDQSGDHSGNRTAVMNLTPCGACRQVMAEFFETDSLIISSGNNGQPIQKLTMAELLPHQFQLPQK